MDRELQVQCRILGGERQARDEQCHVKVSSWGRVASGARICMSTSGD